MIICIILSIPLAYADEEWTSVSVVDPRDNNTQYLFYYSIDNATLSYDNGQYLFYYSIDNATLSYDNEQYPFPEFNFDTVLNTDGYLKFKAPKNFPYPTSYDPIMVLMTYLDGNTDFFDLDKNLLIHDDCFYNTEIFVGNITSIEFVIPFPPIMKPQHLIVEDVPQECLQQTIAGYKTVSGDSKNNREMWKNIRGELVHIFHYSVEKLIERGYLIEKQNE